jgi:hypothetical protein
MDIARLERNQFVYVGTKHTPTALIRIMSPFLFFAPDLHLQMLQSLWIDETINTVAWNKFLQKAREEWRDLMVMVRRFPRTYGREAKSSFRQLYCVRLYSDRNYYSGHATDQKLQSP